MPADGAACAVITAQAIGNASLDSRRAEGQHASSGRPGRQDDQAVKSQRVWLNGPFPNPRACTGMSW
jgi:hypothetical protein